MVIIFDLDGTIYQTEWSLMYAIKGLFDELSLPLPKEKEIVKHIGKTTNAFLYEILPEHIDKEDAQKRFRKLEYEAVRKHGKLFPQINEILEQLKYMGHQLYICSNGSDEYISLVLESNGISKYFDNIYSAKTCYSKADKVKEILLSDNNAVLIGDSFSDIDAALKNKIPIIAVTYGYGQKNDMSDATFFADLAEEIVDYIILCDILYKVKEKTINKDRHIIGINGVDTSGKTIFTENYSRFLSAIGIKNTILHVDDFHNPLAIRCCGETEIDAYYNNAFNYEQLINEILKPLRESGSIDKDVLCLNLDTDKYENVIHYSVDKETVLLIEGVLLFRPPLLEFIDSKIYLHIDFDEVLERVIIRDVPKYGESFIKKYINKYIPVQKQYLNQYDPISNSDIVVYNENYRRPRL